MTRLFIDHHTVEIDRPVRTWADLLENLDQVMERRGRVLTEVQFDGVGEPTFREPDALARQLTTIARIDAVSTTPADLLRDCLLEAAGTVAVLTAEATDVAVVFRGNQPQAGQARLGGVAEQLGQLLLLVQTLQGPLRLVTRDAGEPADGERLELERLGVFVEDLIAGQRSADYQTVADTLEYDIAPFLQTWQARFERLAC
jgi:hypothetical protein